MAKLNPIRVSIHPISLLVTLVVFSVAGCEPQPPADSSEGLSTAEAVPPTAECENFSCAEIGYLRAERINVAENLAIGVPRNHQFENELEVNGKIVAEEVLVSPRVADYVFAPGYDLKPLVSVENFINEHHHLPGVPSAFTVQSSGDKLGIGKSYGVLLEKIEELTLYIIAQEKRIAALGNLTGMLNKRVMFFIRARK